MTERKSGQEEDGRKEGTGRGRGVKEKNEERKWQR